MAAVETRGIQPVLARRPISKTTLERRRILRPAARLRRGDVSQQGVAPCDSSWALPTRKNSI
jgi:hypothetical protein